MYHDVSNVYYRYITYGCNDDNHVTTGEIPYQCLIWNICVTGNMSFLDTTYSIFSSKSTNDNITILYGYSFFNNYKITKFYFSVGQIFTLQVFQLFLPYIRTYSQSLLPCINNLPGILKGANLKIRFVILYAIWYMLCYAF